MTAGEIIGNVVYYVFGWGLAFTIMGAVVVLAYFGGAS